MASLSLVSLLGVDPDPVLPSVTYTAREDLLYSLTSLSVRLFHSYRDEPTSRWGETGVPRENHLLASRTWLVSHVASVGLEPTPVTGMR